MDWILLLLVAGAAVILWRVVQKVRTLRNTRDEDWDARFISQLRRSGVDPFKPVDVDFFLALPSREAAERLAARLEDDLFTPDIRVTEEALDLPVSVQARKMMQINELGIRTAVERLRELVAAEGGRYDGWAPGSEAMGALRAASQRARPTPRRGFN
ncbi:MAG: ribonuclease E inhibitor RraB [Gammaproteobacteria bacterium]